MNKKRIAGIVSVLISLILIVSGVQASPAPQTAGNLTFYENNPILAVGDANAWDSGAILAGHVLYHDDMYHMFYSGTSDTEGAWNFDIGHATSPDGLTWTKDPANPVLTMAEVDIPLAEDSDERVIGLFVSSGYVEDDTWVLYVSRPTNQYQGESTVRQVIAPSPAGPFAIGAENPLPPAEHRRHWDSPQADYEFVLPVDNGYAMYYSIGEGRIGFATSPDGLTWTRYDDPETTGGLFEAGDPILVVGPESYLGPNSVHAQAVQPRVLPTEAGWQMFYRGQSWNPTARGEVAAWDSSIWTATSEDGMVWDIVTEPIWLAQRHGEGVGLNAEYFSVASVDGTPVIYSSFADDTDINTFDLTQINAAFWQAPNN